MVTMVAECGGRRYEVALRSQGSTGRDFEIRIRLEGGSDSSDFFPVEVLHWSGNLLTLRLEGRVFDFSIQRDRNACFLQSGEAEATVHILDQRERLQLSMGKSSSSGEMRVLAQMPGRIVQLFKGAGDSVRKGDALAVIEAMKMQNEIYAPGDGRIVDCEISPGQTVEAGVILFRIEGEDHSSSSGGRGN